MVVGAAGFALGARRAAAFHYEDLPPELEAALNAACRTGGDSHAGMIAARRRDLLRRIARGLLPARVSETFVCPTCGCAVVVSVNEAP